MDYEDKTLPQPQRTEDERPARGPVELDPADFAHVSGGLPNATWPTSKPIGASTSL